jgi:Protein of unknown function (DUF1642).
MSREHYIEKITERLNQLTKDELKDVSILTSAQLGVRQKVSEKQSIENEIVNLKSQLEKQQLETPEVPQFVADWYEKRKDHLEYHIWKYIRWWNDHEKDDFYNFMNGAHSNPIETLINMKNGYTVAKPKIIVSPCPVCGFEDVENNFCGVCGHKNEYVTADEVGE